MYKALLRLAAIACLVAPLAAFDSEDRVATAVPFSQDGSDPTTAVSGIACVEPVGTWPRHCLAAIDEGLTAQRVTLTAQAGPYGLVPLKSILLLRSDDNDVLPPFIGTPPQTHCSKPDKKAKEHDSEAVTFALGYYFVTGSHGCGRTNDAARLSSFLVARLLPDDQDDGSQPVVEISFRLNEILSADPVLSAHFAHDLGAGGISIEGIAGLESGKLYFGLRSPAEGSQAYLLAVDAAPLFSPDAKLTWEPPKTVDLAQAGTNMGIRDLAVVDPAGSRILLLIGPATGEDGSYAVADYDVADGTLGPITTLQTVAGQKAEGLLLIDRLDTKAKILVLHDGVADGGPQIEIVPLH